METRVKFVEVVRSLIPMSPRARVRLRKTSRHNAR